jgi:hypothetical protein
MASDHNAPRSRRALLAAAAGAAGAAAASAALPLTAAAADPDDVVKGTDNATVTTTSITTTSADPVNNPQVAFRAYTANADRAGLVGSTGDETNIGTHLTGFTGVYGWSPAYPTDAGFGTGVWGDSEDVGVYGSGGIGAWADGFIGVRARGAVGGIAVQAIAPSTSEVALQVSGKVQFSRAGKNTIGTGKSSLRINLAGVSASSRIFAVLHSNRSGRYVRAVVPGTNYFTIYLNTTVTSATFVAWFVIN